MADYRNDSREQNKKQEGHQRGGFRMSYNRDPGDAGTNKVLRIAGIAVLCIIAAPVGIHYLYKLPDLYTVSHIPFWNGLFIGTIIGLILHFTRRRQQKKEQEEEEILEELREIKEQEKEEEFDYQNHYRSSGL